MPTIRQINSVISPRLMALLAGGVSGVLLAMILATCGVI